MRNQRGFGLGGVFRGAAYQKGYGLGGVLSRFFNWVSPFFQRAKENLLPVLKSSAKTLGKEAISTAATIARDMLDGKNTVTENINQSIDKLTKPQQGSGINKRRKKQKKEIKKKIRFRDIFDKNEH